MSLEMIEHKTATPTMSYESSKALKNKGVWQALDKINLGQSVRLFVKTLSKHTGDAYGTAFGLFFTYGFLSPHITLREFSMMNLESKLDQIKTGMEGKEATKQARAAAFVSFTGFLQRKTEGLIKKAVPNKEKGRKTFQKIREKTVCDTLSADEVKRFLEALRNTSLRNYLIAAMQIQGAKRISEVLNSRIEDIDWENGSVRFKQMKSDILEKETVVFFPGSFISDLRCYLGGRISGAIFITKSGRQMSRSDVQPVYTSAYKKAGINKKGFTHILRATTITELSRQGFGAEDIVNLSGHSSLQMVGYYDKSGQENNPSRKVNMI